jgi:4-diphosphocytidyl-2-C-methyl-D-erythritol kinase
MSLITLNANAKLNLTLDITGKRPDGYHNIVTEMQEISLHDTVTVTRLSGSQNISVTCNDPQIPTDERNIAYRAAKLMNCGAKIHIEKRIPVMAGLGGSSTNGAAVLKALSELTGQPIPEACAKLGADVPFHLIGRRAKCEGIGDIITPLPDLPPQWYVIVQPDFVCDTKSAYALYKPGIIRTKSNIFQDLYNNEQLNVICSRHNARLTGSGSAVFITFDDEKSAESMYKELDYPFKTIATNIRRN